MQKIEIGDRIIGLGCPCFVIAEAGVNHNGNLDMALKLVDIAVRAGADAVKFQTFSTECVVTKNAPKAAYQKETTGSDESQFQMLKKLELSPQAHLKLQTYCSERSIIFLSSPFEEKSADFLEELNVPAFKIPSGELTNLPFLEHVALKSKPMIVSTGMSTLEEVKSAVDVIFKTGNTDLILLHCVSAYPANPSDANLRSMQTMAKAFDVPIGYSDHTLGTEVALAAVASGACVLEKHITLDRTLPGPDHRASLEPDELKVLISSVRAIEVALGHGRKVPAPCEADIAEVSRKSIVTRRDIPVGAIVTKGSIVMKSPGTGLPPSMLGQIIGRIAAKHIPADTLLTSEMLQ
jgi:N,N'-diacetyllegionaminate synthase